MGTADDYSEVTVRSRQEWRDWLAAHHEDAPGVWLVTYKKASGGPHVSYDDTVREALCFGWVDSQPRKVDDERSARLMTPRKSTSRWSKANKARIPDLEAQGLLAPAGEAAVAAARANGAWSALDDVEALVEPDDLAAALDAVPAARRSWDGFPPSARRGILEWILDAKRPATRQRRIAETVDEAAEGRRANRWPR